MLIGMLFAVYFCRLLRIYYALVRTGTIRDQCLCFGL